MRQIAQLVRALDFTKRLLVRVQFYRKFNDSVFNMVVVAQLVEYQIVALRVMGSSPIFHPKKLLKNLEIKIFLYIFAKYFIGSKYIRKHTASIY